MLILDEDQKDDNEKPQEVQSQSDLANVGVATVVEEERRAKSLNLGEVELDNSKEQEVVEVDEDSPEPGDSPTVPVEKGIREKQGEGILDEDTEELKKERFVKKKPPNQNNLELDVFDDHNIYSLHELTKCGFQMPTSDKDFTLTHEKLIKAVKILLYKVNIQQRKLQLRTEDIYNDFEKKLSTASENTKSGFEEIKHFLHNVHTDFETNQLNYREAHLELENKDN